MWPDSMAVLVNHSVPGRLTNLENSRARAHWACSRCGLGCLGIFSLLSSPFLETARYRLKYFLIGQ